MHYRMSARWCVLIAAIGFTRHTVAVTVEMARVAGLTCTQGCASGCADFVAAAVMNGLLHSIACRDFFLGHGREVIDAKEGQDRQGCSGFKAIPTFLVL